MSTNVASFSNTPQATDDTFLSSTTGITEDSQAAIYTLDVMANDSGGKAKSLWSLDDGTSATSYTNTQGGTSPTDLLRQDTARSEATSTDYSAGGARIWITSDGKVGYDTSTYSTAFRAQLQSLGANEFVYDSFTYAIRLGNGTLSWATTYVQICGVNDAPVVSQTTFGENAISFLAQDIDASDVLHVSAPFRFLEGPSGIAKDGVTLNSLTPTEQVTAVSGTLSVTDGLATANVGSIYLGTAETDNVSTVFDAVYGFGGDDSIRYRSDAKGLFGGTQGANGDTLVMSGSEFAVVDLSNSDQTIGDNTLVTGFENVNASGLAFAVNLTGSAGDNTLNGGFGDDTLSGGDGNDTLVGSDGNDTLLGGEGNDTLLGDANNDSLIGGAGADVLNGGIGTNVASYETALSGVIASLDNSAVNTGDAAGDTYININNLRGSNSNDILSGDVNGNTIEGLAGDDVLIGGAGADILVGGLFSYQEAEVGFIRGPDIGISNWRIIPTEVASAPASGTLLPSASGGAYMQFLPDGVLFNGNATGFDSAPFNNPLYRDTASNQGVLSYNVNVSTPGTYQLFLRWEGFDDNSDSMFARIRELRDGAGGDADWYRLASSVEDGNFNTVSWTGSGGFERADAVGNDVAMIWNITQADIDAHSGLFTMQFAFREDGVALDAFILQKLTADFASYETASAGVVVNLANPVSNTGDAAGDVYIGIVNVIGSSFNDTLTGDTNDNILRAGSGNDVLIGGAGNDTLDGGDGGDTANYVSATTSLTIDLNNSGPQNVGGGQGLDTLVAIENIIGGSGNDTLIGNAGLNALNGGGGDDVLIGGGGADTLTGAAGADTMTGGAGADTFAIASAASPGVVSGSGDAGSVRGFDVITDFISGSDILDIAGTPFSAANVTLINGANSALTIGGDPVGRHTINSGMITFFTDASQALSLSGLNTSAVAAAVDYLQRNDLGNAGVTVAFTAIVDGLAHTYIYQQVGATPNATNDILVDLQGITINSLAGLVGANLTIRPAGISGEAMNLALSDATPNNHNDLMTITVSGVPADWSLNAGICNADGSWTIQTADPSSLMVTTAANFVGAKVLTVNTSWTDASGNTVVSHLTDNIEAYAPGSAIFALSIDDTLTGSSGVDTFVFQNRIATDTVVNFNVATDKIDLIGFENIHQYSDLAIANDVHGNAVITIGEGQTIKVQGVGAESLSASSFLFNVMPHTVNAGTIDIASGAAMPFGGTLENNGSVHVAGTMVMNGDITGTGSFTLNGTGMLEVDGSIDQLINFATGASATIKLNAGSHINSTFTGFGDGNVLDISGLLTASATADTIGQFVQVAQHGSDTTITIDHDGAGAGTDMSTVTLANTTTTLDALVGTHGLDFVQDSLVVV